MKTKKPTSTKTLSTSDKELLKQVAEKLSGRVLFQEKVESAKKFLKNATFLTKPYGKN